jgi:hypothetical protein
VTGGYQGEWRGKYAGFLRYRFPSIPLKTPELVPELVPGHYQALARPDGAPPRGQAHPRALTHHKALGAASPSHNTEAAEAVEADDLIAAYIVVACGFLKHCFSAFQRGSALCNLFQYVSRAGTFLKPVCPVCAPPSVRYPKHVAQRVRQP